MEHIPCEPTKVNISNLSRGCLTTEGIIRQWFKKPSLVNKKVHIALSIKDNTTADTTAYHSNTYW